MELFNTHLCLPAAFRVPAYFFLALRGTLRAGGGYPDAFISAPVVLARKLQKRMRPVANKGFFLSSVGYKLGWLSKKTIRERSSHPMIVCRPYIQTRIFNVLIGIAIPAGCVFLLGKVLPDPDFSHKIYYILSLLLLIFPGLYFLTARCVWILRCDEEEKTLCFVKTFHNLTFPIREIDELSVFKTLRGFDYRFKTARYSFTFEEMDDMSELIAFLKKTNPQLSINSPEDHKYF
jgi:hypothetical protein